MQDVGVGLSNDIVNAYKAKRCVEIFKRSTTQIKAFRALRHSSEHPSSGWYFTFKPHINEDGRVSCACGQMGSGIKTRIAISYAVSTSYQRLLYGLGTIIRQ